MFKHPFSTKGRIRRTEYGLTLLAIYVFYILVVFFMSLFGIYTGNNSAGSVGPFLMLASYVPIVWISIAQSIKRSHDIGNSGWFVLIPFYSLVLLFVPGNVGANKYGPDPKGGKNPIEMMEELKQASKETTGNEGEF